MSLRLVQRRTERPAPGLKAPTLWLAAAVLGAGAPLTPVAAQPQIVVQAESRLEVGSRRVGDTVVIEGTLRDDLGQPLPKRELRVLLRPSAEAPDATRTRQIVRTGRDGRFSLTTKLRSDRPFLSVLFSGDDVHRHAEVARLLELDRAQVRLSLTLPHRGRLDLDRPRHDLVARAHSPAGGAGLSIMLLDERGTQLARGHTDPEGMARLAVTADQLAGPGTGRLIVRSEGDAKRASAQAEVSVARFYRTTLTLAARSSEVRPETRASLYGTLRNSHRPLAGRAVGLYADQEHLATVLTDEQGRFARTVPLAFETTDRRSVYARFDGDGPGYPSAESPGVIVHLDSGADPAWWLLLPAVLLGALAWWVGRPGNPVAPVHRAPHAPGLQPAPRTPGAPLNFELAGRTLDLASQRPIPGARVECVLRSDPTRNRPETPAASLTTDPEGRFGPTLLTAGSYTLRAHAAGWVREEAQFVVPHRGGWSNATLTLESYRTAAANRFRSVAARALSTARAWPYRTNREVLAHAQTGGAPTEHVEPLVELVDTACYGPVPPDEASLKRIEHLARTALDEWDDDSPGSR